ncbi:hypothetical protein Ade02nite_19920 [Paractinoplanes deccanensis]|uniref:Uncharacterized protein n=1 Tax=Paractinoplanes deccanensis TaxID=113561 RepID=A0ABQ3Y024_9ACTN|nr:hypothetical protein [Actinoplanes deccanensis]GID73351.1 hypothetical protein Ade02nite_19920 [Actinoplanes deccanensis]
MTGRNAIDRLVETLDALDEHLQTSDATVKRSERNRIGLLHLHAAFAVYIGPMFALLGRDGMAGPAWLLIRRIPGAPVSLACLLFAGGVILGIATWHRAVRWEIVGLCMLLGWYVTIAVSFGGALLWWLTGGFPAGTPKPAPYTHGVYLHLGALMIVHLVTLIRIRVARRKAAR